MGKKRFTEENWKNDPWFRALIRALHSCKTEEDLTHFLRDIATLSELQAFSERLEVAKQLSRGLSYRQVSENTGASTTTVTRVARFIENGSGGYRKYLRNQQTSIRDESSQSSDSQIPSEQSRQGIQKASNLRKFLGQ